METLRRAFRGYETAQVDRLVSGLYSQLESRLRELEEIRHQNARLSDEIAEFRERDRALRDDAKAIQDALVSAHRQSEEIQAQARKEAELMLQIARETAQRYQEDLKGRIDDLTWQIERLTLQRQRFVASFREQLEGHLASLSEHGAASAPDAESDAGGSELDSDRTPVSATGPEPIETPEDSDAGEERSTSSAATVV